MLYNINYSLVNYSRRISIMPKNVKAPGKTTVSKKPAAPKKVNSLKVQVAPVSQEKKSTRKYPSITERVALAEKQAERLAKTIETRKALIEKTEEIQNERRAALAKNEAQLEKALSRKQRLMDQKDKPAKAATQKLSPEELKAKRAEGMARARAAKKAEKEKMNQLLAALKNSGKTVDDLIAEVKK